MLLVLAALAYAPAAVPAAQATPWADWECPGFPCFIVNFYFNLTRAGATDYKQTCGPIQDMDTCDFLEEGKSFDATDGSGKVIGTHTLKKPHPCHSKNFGCTQSTSPCVQGSVAACQGYCKDLNLVQHYLDICTDYCSVHCP